jgi:two-component system, chemotaxis family, CheB/CheR fusion protein
MKKKTSPPASEQDFPIVGIGASAGGLDAFKKFLKAIPENSGMAYVLVQHLDPRHESVLPDILSRVTTIPVHEITDEIHLAPDNIYVIPSNKTLTTFDGVLKLTPRETKTNLAIDVFFRSLAEVHQSLAIGVVLSGTGSDGTLGLKAIKEYGGITISQKPESAAYESMPQSAFDAEVVDFVLPPEKIPEKLIQICQNYKNSASGNNTDKDEDIVYKQILFQLRQRSGVDFSYYKQTTVKRRIARRVLMSKTESLGDYFKFLKTNKGEQDSLFQDMLIPVTSFFRDPKIFDELSNTIFPSILKNKTPGEPIRIWSAGCSTGEEAFTIAICLNEFLGQKTGERQIQIFASDISEKAITKARSASYLKKDVEFMKTSYVDKYFTKSNGKYQASKALRDTCVFAVQNFLKDPPFAKMDLICCRNALIYMEPYLQKKALANFHYALNQKGFLLLGKSETTGSVPGLFTTYSKNGKIFTPNPVKDRISSIDKEDYKSTAEPKNIKTQGADGLLNDFRKAAETILLNKYTPANVIMNDQMDIVHIQGRVSDFIEPPQGKASFNIIKMAKDGLGFELRNAIHKVKASNAPVIKEGIIIKSGEKTFKITIEISPLNNTIEPYYLIIFRKTEAAETSEGLQASQREGHVQKHIEQLEKELLQNREDMRAITEEQEAANEELQSSNEELLSGSEELQSLNEELESSKEELQSTNEELMILNQEFIENQEQLSISKLFSDAIIATLREPLVVLDRSLRIKTANTSFYKKFNIPESDVKGSLIYEVCEHIFDNTLLRSLLEKILPQRLEMHDYEVVFNLSPAVNCTMLLNASRIISEKNAEQLILLSFEDISERKVAEKHRKEFSEELERKVKERTRQLEQSNTQLDQFTHTTSHEFQEPLRKIVIFSDMLQKNENHDSPQLMNEYLGKIAAASTRMTKLIEDMLNFASVTNYEKLLEKTDLNEILKNVLFDFELLIAEKKARINSGKLPVVDAVPFQMNQLFYDLLYNALKFTQKGATPVIDISSTLLGPEEMKLYPGLNQQLKYHEIVFKDNGIGFNQKYADKIFTMFQRLSHSGSFAGTGIGLAICKKIVQQYNGEIFANGKESGGASFHVILPLQQVHDNPSDRTKVNSPEKAPA